MADMIERVAKRLWDHSFDRMPEPPWEQTTELQKRFNRMLAREAIAAMRVTDDDVMAHPWLGSDEQDAINEYIDGALAPAATGDRT